MRTREKKRAARILRGIAKDIQAGGKYTKAIKAEVQGLPIYNSVSRPLSLNGGPYCIYVNPTRAKMQAEDGNGTEFSWALDRLIVDEFGNGEASGVIAFSDLSTTDEVLAKIREVANKLEMESA